MKKILFVNGKAGFFGGIEKYMHDSATVLRDAGYELCAVFTDRNSEDKADEKFIAPFHKAFFPSENEAEKILKEISASGVDTVFIHKFNSAPLLEILTENFRAAAFIHDHDIYCMRRHKYFPLKRVNCPLPFSMLYCPVCSCMIEKKEGQLKFINPFEKRRILKLVKNKCRAVVLSEYMKNNLIKNGFDANRINKIYPVIENRDMRSEKNRNSIPVILCAGQIIRGKGIDLLLEAAKKISRDFKLVIAGKGNDENRMKKLIKEYGLENRLEIKGFQRDISPEFMNADIVVLPSRWQEPFGMAGPEAFSYKLPVVAFDTGGISEWLRNGENGILVPVQNTDILAEALSRLMEDGEQAQYYGENGWNFVREKLNAKTHLKALEKLMEEL